MNAGGFRSTDLYIVRTANGSGSVPVKAKTSGSPVLIPKVIELEMRG